MIDTAVIHHQMREHGELRFAPELRLRLAKVAATPEDRQRLKVKITQHVPEAAPPAGVTDIARGEPASPATSPDANNVTSSTPNASLL